MSAKCTNIQKAICNTTIMIRHEMAQAAEKTWPPMARRRPNRTDVGPAWPPLLSQGQYVSDAIGKATILNHQYASVFTKEDLDNIPDKGPSLHPNWDARAAHRWEKCTKATDPDKPLHCRWTRCVASTCTKGNSRTAGTGTNNHLPQVSWNEKCTNLLETLRFWKITSSGTVDTASEASDHARPSYSCFNKSCWKPWSRGCRLT